MNSRGTRLKVSEVIIAPPQKRGRRSKPKRRSIRKGLVTTLTPVPGKEGVFTVEVAIEARQFSARLTGNVDYNSGSADFSSAEEHPTSYLKKKGFSIVGYNLTYLTTNLRR